jgi:hypothetical protein
VSNPCRLKYFDQEIVVCREDLMGRMLRNLMGVKEGIVDGAEMKKFVSAGGSSIDRARYRLLILTRRVARSNGARPMSSLPPPALCPTDALGLRPRPPSLSDADSSESPASGITLLTSYPLTSFCALVL